MILSLVKMVIKYTICVILMIKLEFTICVTKMKRGQSKAQQQYIQEEPCQRQEMQYSAGQSHPPGRGKWTALNPGSPDQRGQERTTPADIYLQQQNISHCYKTFTNWNTICEAALKQYAVWKELCK